MRVLGIDPGLAACGYGVVEVKGRTAVAVEFGCWHTASSSPLGRRLAELFTKVEAVIGQYLPDAVAVEESFAGGAVTCFPLAGWVGRSRLFLAGTLSTVVAE
jgi:crossover junction endodeoxyribonuclease RuvC